MAMTNAALQAIFDEMGDRISCIVFDNKVPVFIGYPSSPVKHVNELELKSFGGVDMVGVPTYPDPKLRRDGAMFTYWHPTEFLQIVVASDEAHPKALMDPYTLG